MVKKPALIFLLFCLISGLAFAGTEYRIDIKIDYENFLIDGLAEINFKNNSSKELGSLYLFLFPNIYLKQSPYLNDINFEWVYPGNFSPGSMAIKSVTSQGKPLVCQYVDNHKLPPSVLVEVLFGEKLLPGENRVLKVSYRVKMPRKYGPFGHYRRDILLNGGFYPSVPSLSSNGEWELAAYPEKADFALSVEGKNHFIVNGFEIEKEAGKFRVPGLETDYISLFNTKNLLKEEFKSRKVNFEFYFHTQEKGMLKNILRDVRKFSEFVEGRPELEDVEAKIVLCEAYLRDRLIHPSSGILYFSDRLYKLFPPLRNYHSFELIRGLFYQLLRERIREKEDDRSYDWVTSTLSWFYSDAYIRQYQEKFKRDARSLKLVRIFSFLPQLDQVIYAPQFAFISAYYNQIYSYDYFRQDILDFNNEIRSKRVVYEKLKDRYAPSPEFVKFFPAYLESEEPFRSFARDYFGEGVDKIFKFWLGKYPSINYSLERIDRKKLKDGEYQNTVSIRREAKEGIQEPVTVYLEEWGGEKHFVRWDDQNDEKGISIKTKNRLRTVHIDPFGRLLESKLADNRSPRLYKWYWTDYSVGIDLNALSPTVTLSTQFRRLYGSKNRYNLGGYRDSANFGASIGYTRLFGRLLDALRLSHGIAVSYRFDGLSNDYIVRRTSIEDPSSGLDEIIINPRGKSTMILLQYFFGNILSYTNPKSGMVATFYAGIASKYFGGAFTYYRAGMNWTGIIPLDRSNLVAVKFEFGVSGNSDIPPQQQFFLGGLSGMRGFPQGEVNRVGRNLIFYAVEYRHYLLKDIDINLGSLFRVRDIMGALFVDTGRVSATVEEFANSIANGTSLRSSPHHLFNIKKYDSDFGYGIKFLYDMLGVRGAILSVDVAKSLSDFRDQGIRIYITFGHSF